MVPSGRVNFHKSGDDHIGQVLPMSSGTSSRNIRFLCLLLVFVTTYFLHIFPNIKFQDTNLIFLMYQMDGHKYNISWYVEWLKIPQFNICIWVLEKVNHQKWTNPINFRPSWRGEGFLELLWMILKIITTSVTELKSEIQLFRDPSFHATAATQGYWGSSVQWMFPWYSILWETYTYLRYLQNKLIA